MTEPTPDQPDDDMALGEELAGMEALFNEAVDTDVSTHAIDFLCRARLLLNIADDVDAAKEVVHSAGGREAAAREWQALPEGTRNALARTSSTSGPTP